jgi:hypothetical protein
MTIVLILLLTGLVLYLLPFASPAGGKINYIGLVLVFWAVYFVIAGFGGKALRFADAEHPSSFAASIEGKKQEECAASESTGAGRLREWFPDRQHI